MTESVSPALREKVTEFIRDNPGLTSKQIASRLQLSSSAVARAIKAESNLIAAKKIRAEGQRNSKNVYSLKPAAAPGGLTRLDRVKEIAARQPFLYAFGSKLTVPAPYSHEQPFHSDDADL